ncbi:MAG: HAD family hydrolase [Gammaproteobacteria bacterium]|nr:HAD family hydrolase [Gammaproteobacteria bacterium]
MPLALFDLDHTLVNADTPSLWLEYLIGKALLPARETREKIAAFARDYSAGTLDYPSYLRFELEPLRDHAPDDLLAWRETYQTEMLRPHISQSARDLLQKHRDAGDTLAIITATSRFIAEASARELDVEHLIATDVESIDGRFTGDYTGQECFQAGKIKKLQEWLAGSDHSLDGSWFYSDSINDLPLLEAIRNPVAVNADARLADIAAARGWPTLDLRT